MKTLDSSLHETVINGKYLKAQITVSYDYDSEPIEGSFDFGNEADNAAYLARFEEHGDLYSVNILVEATALGESGSDVLCACHIPVNSFKISCLEVVEENGMINTAIEDLAKNILEKHKQLSNFLEGGN